MIDFLMVSTRSKKRGIIEIYPKFIIKKSSDLMIRGGDFYAIWVEERGLWSTDEQDALRIIDMELDKYAAEHRQYFGTDTVKVLHMWDAESGMIDAWHKYCQKQMRDSFHALDENIIFSNMSAKKADYASKRLKYPLEAGSIDAYDKLISVLYSEEERRKIEWAIGSIVCGDSKKIQKFMVLYGPAGTGKSTVLNLIKELFDEYCTTFEAKELGSSNNQFALEAFRKNPLVAIEHDGKLSRIEDNTRINSLVSHETMIVNEKFKSKYENRFKCFLFIGTNEPVKITDAKSGLLRRLIDVSPSGNKLPVREYNALVKQMDFELGAIAQHCKEVYSSDPHYYDDYIPLNMMSATNDFYNFVFDSYLVFKEEDGTTLAQAWAMYKAYCEEAKLPYILPKPRFAEELKNYFREFVTDRKPLPNGSRPRKYYSGFRTDKFENNVTVINNDNATWLKFESADSVFDTICADCPAQYATDKETPSKRWDDVTTKLSEMDTKRLHYVKVPQNHVVVDFDIPDENGNKSFERDAEAASKFPPTYAELSKSGEGIHLHYIYTGDASELSSVYDDHIEVKVFKGKSSLRRKLTKCNSLPIAAISSGLPLKGANNKMVNFETIKSEKGLRTLIKRNLNKEIHPGTKPSVDFIYKILDDAYSSDLKYDLTDMRNAILAFAANSTHQADYCIKLVNKMKFKSEDVSDAVYNNDSPLVFYDVEVFPNLFLVNWKIEGEGKPVVRMINPSPQEIEELMKYRLIGFNCRRYDNHILYARFMGYTNEQLYKLSQKIVSGSSNCFFGEAYNISYTDVYDFSSKKQSLKKFEIELGIHHQELGLPWDEPVPEEMWAKVAEYCDNDVLATEAVFNARKSDFTARQILAEVADMTVNDTTNSLTTRIIFGNNRHPQDQFNYRDMGAVPASCECYCFTDKPGLYENIPLNDDCYNIFGMDKRPYFPGYKFERGKSTYRGEEVGEGGYVYAEPGVHYNVALLDIASMHPSSIIAENLFGDNYTKRFKELVEVRLAIKHKDFDKVRGLLGGALAKYLTDESTAKDLAQALKIVINSVYGLTKASFDCAFRDNRNVDNIVAKRGALFMINLKHEVQKRGFTVAHIKTDSIKIPNATQGIVDFVMDYGKEYGYTFEHEATYDRMCLVNDAVYIAKYKEGDWTATGTQFQVPYVFKKLFSKEPIIFDDLCETKSVSKGAIYIDLNESLPDVSGLEKEREKALKKDMTINVDAFNDEIAKGHNYIFVGRVGSFCPIKPGRGGGVLYRYDNNKYYAVTGTKGYRWLESEMVRNICEDDIDLSYYEELLNDAKDAIEQYEDINIFVKEN